MHLLYMNDAYFLNQNLIFKSYPDSAVWLLTTATPASGWTACQGLVTCDNG